MTIQLQRKTENDSFENVLHLDETPLIKEFCEQRGLSGYEPLKTNGLSIRVLAREIKAELKRIEAMEVTSEADITAYNGLKLNCMNLLHAIDKKVQKSDELYFVRVEPAAVQA